jgi:hypothetical protein
MPNGPSTSTVERHLLKIRQTRDENSRHVKSPQDRVDLTESGLVLKPVLQLAQEMALSAGLYLVWSKFEKSG